MKYGIFQLIGNLETDDRNLSNVIVFQVVFQLVMIIFSRCTINLEIIGSNDWPQSNFELQTFHDHLLSLTLIGNQSIL